MDSGAREALMDRRKLALVAVARDQPALAAHHRTERQRLAARARAQVEHGAGPASAFVSSAASLRAFVLHLDAALDEIRLRTECPASAHRHQAGCASPSGE
jgi:hypothetical protein